jgi:hypothetical protein
MPLIDDQIVINVNPDAIIAGGLEAIGARALFDITAPANGELIGLNNWIWRTIYTPNPNQLTDGRRLSQVRQQGSYYSKKRLAKKGYCAVDRHLEHRSYLRVTTS